MAISALGFVMYLGAALPLMGWLSFAGIGWANALSYSIQGVLLVLLLNRRLPDKFRLGGLLLRAGLSALLAGLCIWLVMVVLPIPLSPLFLTFVAVAVGTLVGAVPIWQEIRLLIQL